MPVDLLEQRKNSAAGWMPWILDGWDVGAAAPGARGKNPCNLQASSAQRPHAQDHRASRPRRRGGHLSASRLLPRPRPRAARSPRPCARSNRRSSACNAAVRCGRWARQHGGWRPMWTPRLDRGDGRTGPGGHELTGALRLRMRAGHVTYEPWREREREGTVPRARDESQHARI
jgi:hypothetical protein